MTPDIRIGRTFARLAERIAESWHDHWCHQKWSTPRLSHERADGGTTPKVLAAWCTRELHDIAREEYADCELRGWRIDVFEPERVFIDKIVNLVAVDESGRRHSIAGLAGLSDEDAEKR